MLLLFHKPFNVLSQFTREVEGQITLADYLKDIPNYYYPIGRLDKDSEGLLLLTNDNDLKTRLLDPKFAHPRTYLAQVEGVPSPAAISLLTSGVTIRVNKKDHLTRPAQVELEDPPPNFPERNPPVRFRKHIPTSWLRLTLTEGKNRQVRRMCAKVGFPVLRLIRVKMDKYPLGDLPAGAHKWIG